MIDKKDSAFLAQNIKGTMMSLLAQWNAQMDQDRGETEFAPIRPSDMRVFGQLRGRTVRLSQIHRELGVSRQAAQQAVERLVTHGVLQVDMAENSQRDKTVSITSKGQDLRALAAKQIREIEAQCIAALGKEQTETLRQLLNALLASD
jgi:DNA-binding MarR family transcriptional regulator